MTDFVFHNSHKKLFLEIKVVKKKFGISFVVVL